MFGSTAVTGKRVSQVLGTLPMLALAVLTTSGTGLALELESRGQAQQAWSVVVPDRSEMVLGLPVVAGAHDFAKMAGDVQVPDSLFNPAGMAKAPDGKVYVVASGNDRIDVYAGNGSYLESWGDSGTGPGQFQFHNSDENWNYGDIAIDSDGTFYIADPGNNRLQIFDKDRNFVDSVEAWERSRGREFDSGYQLTPAGVAIDETLNRIYIADAESDTVKVYRTDGVYLQEWGTTGKGFNEFGALFDLAIAPDSTVYVPDFKTSVIYHYSADGELLGSFGSHGVNPGQFMGVAGVAVDGAGNLYVADYLNEAIKVVSPQGKVIGMLGEGLGLPTYVMVSSPGMIWVSYEETNTVERFSTVEMPAARTMIE